MQALEEVALWNIVYTVSRWLCLLVGGLVLYNKCYSFQSFVEVYHSADCCGFLIYFQVKCETITRGEVYEMLGNHLAMLFVISTRLVAQPIHSYFHFMLSPDLLGLPTRATKTLPETA